MGHEAREVWSHRCAARGLARGLAKLKVCPRGTTPAAKHDDLRCFPPLYAKHSPKVGESHAKKARGSCRYGQTERLVSRFCGRSPEKPAKEIRFFICWAKGTSEVPLRPSAHTHTRLEREMPSRETANGVRTRARELVEMSKSSLKARDAARDTPSSCNTETRKHLLTFPLTLPKFVCFSFYLRHIISF